MTNRELYRKYKEEAKNTFSEASLRLALAEANGYPNFSFLITHFDDECKDPILFENYIKGLKEGKPIQYLTGHAQFLDLVMDVNPSVLIPRPETEEMTLLTSQIIKDVYKNKCSIGDIGTGSGCISIFLKKKSPDSKVYATDISKDALKVAKNNAKKNECDITFYEGNLFEPFIDNNVKLDVLISNPPYIGDEKEIDTLVFNNEPHSALLAKPATKHYEEILKNYKKFMNPKSMIVFEIGENMESDLKKIMEKYLENGSFIFKKDMYGKTRYLFIIFEEEKDAKA